MVVGFADLIGLVLPACGILTSLALLVCLYLLLRGRKNTPQPMLAPRSSLWPKARAAHLLREPVCQWCGAAVDLEVHHLLPVHFPDGALREIDPNNMLTLCRRDHFEIGHLRDWKACNVAARTDCAIHRIKVKTREYPVAGRSVWP